MESPKPGALIRRSGGIETSLAITILTGLMLWGCTRHESLAFHPTMEDSIRIVQETLDHRSDVDHFFRSDPESPFVKDTTIHFTGIRWFPPDIRFCFRSLLYRYDHPSRVTIYGTKGESRPSLRYGYFVISFDGKEYRLDVYKPDSAPDDPELSIWFTDQTTGHETYHVGRYVDVGRELPDESHVYFINLNDAYNPYCAYSALYSCAIPAKEDYLDFAVRAGEMNYSE